MADEFKKVQSKKIGPGGWDCPCCGACCYKHKNQKKARNNLRRYARRKLKRKLKDYNNENFL